MNVESLQWKSKKLFKLNLFLKFIICGILTSFLFPPFFIMPIGFLVFPLLFFLLIDQEYKSKRKHFHFISGLLYGFTFNFIVLFWIKEPFLIDNNSKNFYLISYLLVFYCSLYYGLCFLFLSLFNNNLSKLVLLPIFFVLCELLREIIGYGFPWITFALASSANTFSLSLIYYFGTYGLSYLTIVIFLTPALFIFFDNFHSFFLKTYILIISIIIFICIILIIYRLNNNDNTNYKNIKLSLAQLNFSLIEKINKTNLEKRFSEIYEIIYNNDSNIIVFAENDYPFLIENSENSSGLKEISSILNDNQTVILGATRKDQFEYYNTFISIDKNNVHFFDKKILVPFGEFLPFRNILGFLDKIVMQNDYSKGKNDRYIKTINNLNVLPVICYEIIFFNNLLNKKNYKSEIIINITNDSWFGKFSGPHQHFYLSRMRAAEFNKPLIRVSSNGISAFVNNKGLIIDYIPLNKKEIKKFNIAVPLNEGNLVNYHSLIFIYLFIMFVFSLFMNLKKNE